jgi:hypothetical protein
MEVAAMRVWMVAMVALVALPAWSQGPPVLELSARAFEGREAKTYYGVALERDGWFLRGVGARKEGSARTGQATLLHGGSDFEFGGTLPAWRGITPQLGVSLPDTASRRQKGAITARLRWEQGMFSVEPQAILGRDALIGVAVGAKKTLSGLVVTGSVTPILSGKNGVSNTTGAALRKTLWEAGITRGNITLGVTNALGPTTGFGLSPSVSGTALLLKVRTRL